MVYPCVGAVVSLFKGYDAGYKGLIPPYIVLTEPQGRFSEAGFLGRATSRSPRAATRPQTRSRSKASSPRASPTSARRTGASCSTSSTRWRTPCRTTRNWRRPSRPRQQAYDLILGDAGKVFDLSQEKDEVRDRYGRNTFGQSCLVARRLVEQGVPYITINYDGWDTHKQNFQTMRRKLPELDKGMATLLQDLPSAACWTAPSSGAAANSAGRRRSSGKRRGTAAAAITARSSPRWWPAAASRAARWSALGREGEEVTRTAPSIRST